MKRKRKYVTFLSFADPDRELARLLSQLFAQTSAYVYFAPDDLPKAGTPEWRKEIISAIKQSSSFLPIYTRHSLRRPWVLYESGVADSVGLHRFPARVSSVSPVDIDYLPTHDAFYYDLSDTGSLAQLVVNVCSRAGGDRDTLSGRVEREFSEHAETVKRIREMAKTRWVFIAGNTAKGASEPGSGVTWYSTQSDYEARLRDVVEMLTETLLESGFSIAACPQVHAVGRHVTRKALDCLASKHYDQPVEFKIGGIHPIDREAREIQLTDSAKKKWLEHILAFRITYLSDQEWLLVVGGNEGTGEEFAAAQRCGLKVFAVPCFGGTGRQIHDTSGCDADSPCGRCQGRDGMCGAEGVRKIVDWLKQPRL